MYLVRTPRVLKSFAHHLVWDIQPEGKELFLTFDDGPEPAVTVPVLEELAKYNAKATFFLVGRNAQKHPALVQRILDEGHAIGNHTFDHLDGWKHRGFAYYRDFLKASETVPSTLFRPPYGRIRKEEALALSVRSKVIMWDVLSADFDTAKTAEECLRICLKHSRPGSIVVFHDSLKAADRVLGALPKYLKAMVDEGYRFSAIDAARLP